MADYFQRLGVAVRKVKFSVGAAHIRHMVTAGETAVGELRANGKQLFSPEVKYRRRSRRAYHDLVSAPYIGICAQQLIGEI